MEVKKVSLLDTAYAISEAAETRVKHQITLRHFSYSYPDASILTSVLERARDIATGKNADTWTVDKPRGRLAIHSNIYDQTHLEQILNESAILVETTKASGFAKALQNKGYNNEHFKGALGILFSAN